MTDAVPESPPELQAPAEPAPPETPETPEMPSVKYLRETRNAVVFIAWLLAVVTVLGVAAAIVVAVHVHDEHGPPSASCASQGGTDASC